MTELWITLGLGFALGLRHALDADHLVAVTTLLSEEKHPVKGALVGTFWGIGHTTSLFIAGLLVLLLNITIPADISAILEACVGLMLILLGFRAFWLVKNQSVHTHIHKHDGQEHEHLHANHRHQHGRPFLIGALHGLAGSGGLMVLVLSTIKDLTQGIVYILVFGIGSVVSMTIISFLIGLPYLLTVNKISRFEMYLKTAAGLMSIFFGIVLISDYFAAGR